ncbi:odorant receptor 30a-like [Cylas formicarius]|uniref:odorant receptor 30a-like n=1 Tax=Cylas formicarius TaxID=197179 RepID=UPI002958C086|nr:odorant receptor 30a-like [Cylas formicarius]
MASDKGYFGYIRRLMMMVGIWRLLDYQTSTLKRRIYEVYAVLFQLICLSALVSLIGELPILFRTNNATAAMDNIGKIIATVVVIFKMTMWRSNQMLRLMRLVLHQDSDIRLQPDSQIKAIYQRHQNYDDKFISLIVSSAVMIAVCAAGFGDVDCYLYTRQFRNLNQTQKPLPMNLWYPFDRNRHYVFVLIDQNIRPSMACLCIGVVSASVNSVIVFLKLQLTLLQRNFRSFDGCKGNDLKALCVEHQKLIEFVAIFNGAMRNIIFLEYTVSSLTFATVIFQITTGDQLVFSFTMLAYISLQLLTFAWNSNEILIQSIELAKAIYESRWYDQSKSTKLLLYTMMMRCQKPLCLRIGLLGVMDLNAGLSRLKLGYSYTSVMKT